MLDRHREEQCRLYDQMELISAAIPDRPTHWLKRWLAYLHHQWQRWSRLFNHRPVYYMQQPDNTWWGVYIRHQTHTLQRSSDREVRHWLETMYQLTVQHSSCSGVQRPGGVNG